MPIPSGKDTAVRISAKNLVQSTVQEWIVTGVMKPGEKVVDTELAKYFSVSRTPAREALQALAELGLVEVIPSCGTSVAEINWEDIRQCYEMLAELHVSAARMVYSKVTPKELAQLRKANEEFRVAVEQGDISSQQKTDAAFHGCLIEMTGNKYLRQFVDQLLIKVMRAENLFFADTSARTISYQQHLGIIEAIEQQDKMKLEQISRENWIRSYEFVRQQAEQ